MGEQERTWRRLFRLPQSTGTLDRDITEELAFHMAERMDELQATGLSEADAREHAAREFGDMGEARRELSSMGYRRLRRQNRAGLLDALGHDVRYAVRALGRSPWFSAAVVVTLGIGIGATAAIFSIADRLLLRAPAHVEDPGRVVPIGFKFRSVRTMELVTYPMATYPNYAALREHVGAFSEVGAWSTPQEMTLDGPGGTDAALVGAATASFFRLLGVQPAVGRFYTDEEDSPPAGSAVAVLSHAEWQRRYHGDRDVVGRELQLAGRTHTIIGVAPHGFSGTGLSGPDIWVPVAAMAEQLDGADWHVEEYRSWLRPVARLAPGATAAAAAAEATAVDARHRQDRYERDPEARVVFGSVIPGRGADLGADADERRGARISLWLLGVSALVLLIACANVANLLLARAIQRRGEIAVRLALGVSRGRLAGQLAVETGLLAILGGALGVLLAAWAGGVMRQVLVPGIDWQAPVLDARLLVVTGAAIAVAALLAGLAPVLFNLRVGPAAVLRGGSSGRHNAPVRAALTMAQGTLCALLLVGCGYFTLSLYNLSRVPLGYEPADVVVVDWLGLDMPAPRRAELFDRARERLAGMPQVAAAAIATTAPMGGRMQVPIRVPGVDSIPHHPAGGPYVSAVSPEYFEAVGTPIVRGRAITAQDGPGSAHVVVVSETMARLVWSGQEALGQCIHVGPASWEPPCAEVVGVAADARMTSVQEAPGMWYYMPLAQARLGSRTLVVRTVGHAGGLDGLRSTLQALEPGLPYLRTVPLPQSIAPELAPWRLGAITLGIFSAVALILAALGMYAVIAHDVGQRQRELGLRMALGAQVPAIFFMVLRHAALLTLGGVTVGLVLALLLASRLEPLLFQVQIYDVRLFTLVGGVLLACGTLAAIMPARRAVGIEPAETLRSD